MRRFELSNGTSDKFWEVAVDGAALTVHFGRIGAKGQTKTKAFPSPLEALEEQAALIAEKTKKGYVEIPRPGGPAASGVTSGPAAPPRARTAAATEASATRVLLRGADGVETPILLSGARVVDGEGDARRVQSLDSEAAAKDHFERLLFLRQKSGARILRRESVAREPESAAEEELTPEGFDGDVEVKNGRMVMKYEGEESLSQEVCAALVRRLAQRRFRSVQLICSLASPGRAWEQAINGTKLEVLRAFIFDTPWDSSSRQEGYSVGDLAAVLAAAPGLERLYATGTLALTPFEHSALQQLFLIGAPLTLDLVRALTASSLPALSVLGLSLSSETTKGPDDALLDALARLRTPKLRSVHLSNVDDVPAFLDGLLVRGLPPPWRTLTIQGSWRGATDIDELAPIINKHAAILANLEVLAVPMNEVEPVKVPSCVRDVEDFRLAVTPHVYESW